MTNEITALRAHLQTMVAYMESKGYDRYFSVQLSIKETEVVFSGYFIDKFQENLPFGGTVQSGHQSFHGETVNEVWTDLRKVMSRERRELEVMLKQIGAGLEMGKELRSKAAGAFVAELTGMRAQYAGLLENRGPTDDLAFGDSL